MKIGYPCINLSLDCRSSHTFRLKNYSEDRIKATIESNLKCLQSILEYNLEHQLLFFRITSDLIPFASHEVMDFDWQVTFRKEFQNIGQFIRKNKMRITMHPGQYTVLNSKDEGVFQRSLKEFIYHVEVLGLMELDSSAKVQIHIGGVYGEKEKSLERFIRRYDSYEKRIKNRLVIENDDKSYDLNDCLKIYENTDVPIIFDVYHHRCNNSGDSISQAFGKFYNTWKNKDGLPIIHYSSEHPEKGKPSHADHINVEDFKTVINNATNYNFDIMLEVKDKEQSALKVLSIIKNDKRFNNN